MAASSAIDRTLLAEARIEAPSAEIDCTILTSADFALQCPSEIEHGTLGSLTLKGVAVPQLVYGVA